MATLEFDIRTRRDTDANWVSTNPVLGMGENGIVTIGGVPKRIKVGDGITAWNALPYTVVTEYDIGTRVASLVGGKVPVGQIDQVAIASSTAFTPAGNIAATNVQTAIQELDTEKVPLEGIRSAGVVTLPTFTNNGNGTVTISSGQYSLYDNQNYTGVPKTYTIAGATLALADNSASYIIADYNAGTPQLTVITSVPPPSTTDSNYIPVFSAFRYGSDVHHFSWDNLALGLAEKLNQRFRRTDRFHIDNGLTVSEVPTRIVSIGSGGVWAGGHLITLDSLLSTSPETHYYYHTAGAWTRSTLTQYNNTQYDNGTNLVGLTNSRYAVNWIYRSVQQSGAMYVLLGGGDYTLTQAQASLEPVKPSEVATQAVLVGRIIVLRDAATATQIDNIATTAFGTAQASNHNDLSLIQGGSTDQYYHFTLAEHTRLSGKVNVLQTTTKTSTYNITTADYTIRCDGSGGGFTVTLPNATTCTGQIFAVKKVSTSGNIITIATTSSQTIDGSLTAPISVPYLSLNIQSNGTNWDII